MNITNVSLIQELSSLFQVYLTATFLRYTEIGEFPLMFIYIQDGIIKWKKHSSDFPFSFLPYNSKVPASTVAGDYFYHERLEEKAEKINAIEWFPDNLKLKYEPETELWEPCYKVSDNAIVFCLWTA